MSVSGIFFFILDDNLMDHVTDDKLFVTSNMEFHSVILPDVVNAFSEKKIKWL